ncbi:unnamed protein product [Brugia pahangi]|uniref:Uncharacterized protein n=1 Tax=Brugia pahangi TaxID=6280 RepID=A0A0N4TCF5_BRUPA|nr:unnamed protein product [Brugia pahangi]
MSTCHNHKMTHITLILILQLPYFLRQFTYLICRSLKNLIQQSAGSTTDAYTD